MSFLSIAQAVDLASKGEQVQTGLTQKIAEMLAQFFIKLPSWIAGVLVFLLSIGVARMIKRSVETRISEHIDEEENEAISVLIGRVTYFGVLTLGTTIALKIAGIDLTTILAAVAFGIGFALRDLIMNFIAGIMLLVSKQFIIGDFIKIEGQVGKVVEIQSRATILKAVNGTKLIIPNSKIFSNVVTSFTSNPMRRIDIPVYVAYGTDLDYAVQVTLDVLKKHPKILKKPAPSVRIIGFGGSSIDMKALCWVSRDAGWLKVRHEMITMIDKAYTDAGIIVPYDIVHIETGADTAEEWKGLSQRATAGKSKYEEMRKARLAARAAKAALASSAQPQNVPPPAPTETTNIPNMGTPVPQQLVAVPIVVEADATQAVESPPAPQVIS
ncbi:MAG: MscS Mechanosensitive ion channel [Candidatus Peregrinibacteria bacterium GW2011_GWA2_47_7]|nr:MAG: MscS Mechanosensitive ion channel [Candidatus Peregrinibacteria bacterium GW2011_GWA2_47_7]